jgi:folate-dependent phosphoribosylglycinamide formyltransferase PurN
VRRRIFLLAEDLPALLPRFFEAVLDRTPGGTEVVGAALAAPLPPPHSGLRHHLRLAGPRRWPALATYEARSVLRREPRSVARVLAAHGVAVERVASPNDPAFVERLRGLRPDVAFNAAARLLKPAVLGVPTRGWMNRHAGKLPDYRGVSPIWWALYNGEPTVTVTFHTMTEAVDGGRVVWEHDEPVGDHDSVVAVYERLLDAAALGFWEAMATLERGDGRPVDLANGAYYRLPDDGGVKAFRRRGLRYV